jgi:hypothetical protein
MAVVGLVGAGSGQGGFAAGEGHDAAWLGVGLGRRVRFGLERLAQGAVGAGAGMVDGRDASGTGGVFERELGRVVVPYLGAAIKAHDEGRGGGEAQGEAQVGAVDGFEGAVAAEVRRNLRVAFDDLAADNPAFLGDGTVLTAGQWSSLTYRDRPAG